GPAPPSHLTVLKLAALALRTLRVLELRSYGTSHSPPSASPPQVAILSRSTVPGSFIVLTVQSARGDY
ncbi:hypothetical protein, partial [Methanoculleus chikugoensis]|uniref:hypothetical protein n=1 Tax=Methanoculleus chikugoensis TaxID=118126 RepID=UPI001FB23420